MSTRPVSSRLNRQEQRKFLRQTLIMIGAAVGLIVLFIFVILPQSVSLVGRLTGANIVADLSDTLSPQVPIISAPPTATPSAQLKLTGYGEAKSTVVLIVNANEQSRQTISDDGQFTLEVMLNEGSNIISAYAVDESKNESEPSRSLTVTKDSEPPKLEVSEPQEAQQFELRKNQQIMVKGLTDSATRVYINDRSAFTQADGAFSASYQLIEGENILRIRAEDPAGNQTTKELKVNFKL